MLTAAIVVLCCLIVEGFFSGSEMAVVNADRHVMRERADSGDRGARLVLYMLGDSKTLLATTLIGTNLALITSTVVLTLALVATYGNYGEFVAVAMLSPIVLIFGEIVPKTVFQQYSDRIAPRVIWVLAAFRYLFAPILFVLTAFTGLVATFVGRKRASEKVTREQLQKIIETDSAPGGEITAPEREMIANVLDVEDTTVDRVMIPLSEVLSVDIDTPYEKLVDRVRGSRHTRLPVYKGRIDNIEGVIHAFDLISPDSRAAQARDLMRPAVYVPVYQPALDVFDPLRRSGMGMAVVVNEYGGAEGVVTLEDILEEIVGEIDDEYDEPAKTLVTEGPGIYRVPGRLSVERLNEVLRVSLPEGETYDTIAGLVLERLKRMPEPGDVVKIDQIEITVSEADERAIEELRLKIRR